MLSRDENTPAALLVVLAEAGMSVRLSNGRLLINPIASLLGDLREQVITHRPALVAYLEEMAQQAPREAALAAVLPPDFDELPSTPEGCTLLTLVDVDGTREHLAVDTDYWTALTRWAAERKAVAAAEAQSKAAKEAAKQKAQQRRRRS